MFLICFCLSHSEFKTPTEPLKDPILRISKDLSCQIYRSAEKYSEGLGEERRRRKKGKRTRKQSGRGEGGEKKEKKEKKKKKK